MKKRVFFLILLISVITAIHAEDSSVYDSFINSISKTSVKSEIKNVAVLPFAVVGSFDKNYGYFLSEQFTHHLNEAKLFSIVERVRMDSVLKEHELSMSGISDTGKALKIGRILSVDAVITGVAYKQNNKVIIILKIINVETGKIIATSEVKTGFSGSASSDKSDFSNIHESDKTGSQNVNDSKNNSGAVYTIEEQEDIKYQILDLQPVRHGKTLYFIGEVFNSGTTVIKKPDLQVVLYSSSGSQVGVIRCFAERNVYPGERIPFRGIQTKAPRFKKYELIYEPEEDDLEFYLTDFSVSNLKMKKHKTYSYYTFTGSISNDISKINAKLIKIIISMYDKKGKFVGHGIGFPARKKLKYQQSSPFKAHIYSYSMSGKATSFKLHFAAHEDK